MKRPILICLLGITLGIAFVYLFQARDSISEWFTKPAESNAQVVPIDTIPPDPEYQDVPRIRESFVLTPGAGRFYSMGQVESGQPFQIRWASSSPADIGIIPTSWMAGRTDYETLLASSLCRALQVTRFSNPCTLPPETNGVEMTLLIVDTRNVPSTLAGFAAGFFGARGALEQATANNNAALVLTQRQCVAHCP
jgi:hypothetical protein